MMHALADKGSHIDTAAFAVFIALMLVGALGAWIGWRFGSERHACLSCGQLTAKCSTFCGPCETASREPLTPAERAKGVAVLEEHLARWRGDK